MKIIGDWQYPETSSELKQSMLSCIDKQIAELQAAKDMGGYILESLDETALRHVRSFVDSFVDDTAIAEAEAYEAEFAKARQETGVEE